MEKLGVEIEEKPSSKVMEKVAKAQCVHPEGKLHRDGDVVFCTACNKYLAGVGT